MDNNEKKLLAAMERVEAWKGQKPQYVKVPPTLTASFATGTTWKVTVDGKDFAVKVPGEGVEQYVQKGDYYAAAASAAKLGSGAQVVDYVEDLGVTVLEWLEGYKALTSYNVYESKLFYQMNEIIRKFHQQGTALPRRQTPFEHTLLIMQQAKTLGAYIPTDFPRMEYMVKATEEAIMTAGINWVPCHNDLVVGHYSLNKETGDMKLDGWDYAAMGDECWDLAVMSGALHFSEGMDMEWIHHYYGEANEEKMCRMKLYKLLSDIRWLMWTSIQIVKSPNVGPLGFDWGFWFTCRYARVRQFLADQRIDHWLNYLKGRSEFYM